MGVKMNKTIEEMFEKTYVKDYGEGARRYYKSKRWARVIWDIMHPESPCKDFDIHHKDSDKTNDNIDNLQRLTRAEHNKLHMTGNKYWLGKKHTDSSKKKISLSKVNLSDETRKKMSINNTGSKNPAAKAVIINGQIFSTIKEAAYILSISTWCIWYRLKHNKPGYSYCA